MNKEICDWGCPDGYHKAISDDQREESVAIRERTRIIKALEGLKKEIYKTDSEGWGWKLLEENEIHCCPGDDAVGVYELALDQAIKAVGESSDNNAGSYYGRL